MRTALVFVFLMSGCATQQSGSPSYGNFVSRASTASHQKMASDAVRQLDALYAPAMTRFDVSQPTADPFGAALVQTLRQHGYALAQTTALQTTPPAGPDSVKPTSTAVERNGVTLRYVLDELPGTNLIRLTLQIEDQMLTRAYQVADDGASPASQWIRKE